MQLKEKRPKDWTAKKRIQQVHKMELIYDTAADFTFNHLPWQVSLLWVVFCSQDQWPGIVPIDKGTGLISHGSVQKKV